MEGCLSCISVAATVILLLCNSMVVVYGLQVRNTVIITGCWQIDLYGGEGREDVIKKIFDHQRAVLSVMLSCCL